MYGPVALLQITASEKLINKIILQYTRYMHVSVGVISCVSQCWRHSNRSYYIKDIVQGLKIFTHRLAVYWRGVMGSSSSKADDVIVDEQQLRGLFTFTEHVKIHECTIFKLLAILTTWFALYVCQFCSTYMYMHCFREIFQRSAGVHQTVSSLCKMWEM